MTLKIALNALTRFLLVNPGQHESMLTHIRPLALDEVIYKMTETCVKVLNFDHFLQGMVVTGSLAHEHRNNSIRSHILAYASFDCFNEISDGSFEMKNFILPSWRMVKFIVMCYLFYKFIMAHVCGPTTNIAILHMVKDVTLI